MSKTNWITRAFSHISIVAIILTSIIASPSVSAAIAAGDHFTLTANPTTVDAGAPVTLTVAAYTGGGVPRAFTGSDKICLNINDATNFSHSANADVTAVGATLTVTDYSVGTTPFSLTSGSDLSGTNNNAICFNTTGAGDAETNTITVTATSNFNVFAWANGIAINDASDTYLGEDFANVTVNTASEGASYLLADFGSVTTAEIGEEVPVTIKQLNIGGGLVSSVLSDAVIDLKPFAVNMPPEAPLVETELIESSEEHGLDVNNVVKFTSGNMFGPVGAALDSYYVVSTDASNTTFKVVGGVGGIVYSNSNVIKVTGMSSGVAVDLDVPGSVVTANQSSDVATAGPTILEAGDIVSLAGCAAGYYSVVSAVNDGVDSIVTVIGPTACTTEAGSIAKIEVTAEVESAYTVGDAAAKDGYISSIDGDATVGSPTAVTGQSLTNGLLSISVVPTEEGDPALTLFTYSPTLGDFSPGQFPSLQVGAATDLSITGYGPPSGQPGFPTNGSVDVFVSKNPASVAFPLTNTTGSEFSITDPEGAVEGTWQSFQEGFGNNSFYRIVFTPTSQFSSGTLHTVSILRTLATGAPLLQPDSPALNDSVETKYSYTFTTGDAGGEFMHMGTAPGGMGGGFTGTFGGDVPPMAMLGYPRPESWDVPTNILKIIVDFDREMDATTFSDSISLKAIGVNEAGVKVETSEIATTVSPTTGTAKTAYLTITGDLAANSEYRVVVTRDVKDTKGKQIAGMPLDENNNPQQGFGFGYANMGSFKANFHTGTGATTMTSTLMGVNLDRYPKVGGIITEVPPTTRIKASFDKPLDPSTVTLANVSLKVGSSPFAGSVSYSGSSNTIEFRPEGVLLPSTTYTFNISANVKSVTNNAVTATTRTFTTGAADAQSPEISFVEADNYGLKIQFNESMSSSSVENKAYWTLKTCSGVMVNDAGDGCLGGGSPSTVSLMTANAHYDEFENTLWMNGVTLTGGDGFYIEATNDVKDAANNAINGLFDSWTGKIMGADNFQGGQGMSTMANLEMKDFNMETMGMTPIFAGPMNSMAGATTKYFINFPVEEVIPTGGWVEFTFPNGFTVTGAKKDAQSPMNRDFNGPAAGVPTFADNITDVRPTPTDGIGDGQVNDGVGYISAANKVYVKLNAATNERDFLHIDLDGIVNSSEPKDPATAGYSVQIKTYDSDANLLEAMQSMPFYISQSGEGSVSGRVTTLNGELTVGLNGVKVFLFSPFTGPMETTTLNGGDPAADGYYSFSNLPSGQYMISTEPVFTVGEATYTGKMSQEPITVTGEATKNFTVTAQNGTTSASQPVTISYPNGINTIDNLGFNPSGAENGDSIDIFAGGPNGFVVKTVPRSTLAASNGGTSYTTTMYLPSAGNWMIGVGPAMPRGPKAGAPAEIDWMPTQPVNVNVLSSDVGGDPKSGISFSLTVADKTIEGKTVDVAGTAIPNVEVYAYNPKGGIGSHTTSDSSGVFTLNVMDGTYKVGAFMPGMPSSTESFVVVDDDSFWVNGSNTESTGSSGLNQFNIKIAKTSITIQGRVSTGSSAIANAAVWAHRTDSTMPPIHAQTDSTGNYTLYVTAGTWKIESDAPGYGYLGSKTVTVTTTSLTSQDFTVAAGQGSITGLVNYAGPVAAEGVIVTAYGPGGGNETKTDSSGAYTLSLPISGSPYTLKLFAPGIGNVAQQTITVDGEGTVVDPITIATLRSVTVDIVDPDLASETVSEDILITFKDADGNGNELVIPAGSSAGTISIPDGTYYMETSIPGVNPSAEGLVFNGGAYADGTVNFDGDGDDVGIMLPALYTVSGRNPQSLDGASLKIMDTTSKKSFSVVTSLNGAGGNQSGEYSFRVPLGTYTLTMSKAGYISTSIDLIVTGDSTDNDLELYPLVTRTVTGSVKVGDTGISGAKVYAEITGGGVTTTSTESDGTYTLPLKEGVWTISASADGYEGAVPLVVDVSTESATEKNFTVTALTEGDALAEPQTESITPANGGIVNDTETNTEIIVDPNDLGSETDAGQITIQETNEIVSTPSANPVGNAQEIKATDPNGNPINTLDDEVTIVLQRSLTELDAEGIDTPEEANEMTTAYWDETANEWVPQATTLEFYNDSDVIIPRDTVDAEATLAAAGVDHIKFTSQTDHFTTFAPIVSSGATPPATPTNLAAVAGNAQVVLTWDKNAEGDMLRYDIWEANVTEGILTTLTQVECATTPCTKTITGLTNGTAYSFQIMAVDADGNSSAGSTAVDSTPVAPAEVVVAPSGGGGSPLLTKKKTTVTETPTTETDTTTTTTTTTTTPGTTVAKVSKTPLKDISGHWAQTYIEDLYEKGIVSGADESHYNPDKPITRAEFVKIVVNTYNIPMQDAESVVSSFKDVKESEWYAAYIQAAYDKGIVEGYTKNTFNPNKPITRAEAMKVILLASGKNIEMPTQESGKFKDVKLKDWYAKYVEYAAANGIVTGYEDGTFGPNNPITRAEIAKIADLMLQENLVGIVMGILNN